MPEQETSVGAYSLTYDEEKNRIFIKATGFWTVEVARRFTEAYRKILAQMQPGFTVVSDVRGFTCGNEEVQALHAEAVRLDAEAGVRKVARVVGDTPLAGIQLRRISRSRPDYASQNFETLEAAEAYLDGDGE